MDGEIDPAELSALLEERDGSADDADGAADESASLRIVDIRDRRGFDRGHLPDSECIPFPELTSRIAELEGADRIVTVCPHGVASQQAARLIGSYEG
ncbi:MAG: rhodanese-like domain-containing protein, partial [Halorubrum sp.]